MTSRNNLLALLVKKILQPVIYTCLFENKHELDVRLIAVC